MHYIIIPIFFHIIQSLTHVNKAESKRKRISHFEYMDVCGHNISANKNSPECVLTYVFTSTYMKQNDAIIKQYWFWYL